MTPPIYRWESPLIWLIDARADGRITDQRIVEALIDRLTNDEVQDLFQDDMTEDGYFDPLCEECHEPICEDGDGTDHQPSCSRHPDRQPGADGATASGLGEGHPRERG